MNKRINKMFLIFLGLASLGLFALLANIISGLADVAGKVLPPIIIIGGILLILICIA